MTDEKTKPESWDVIIIGAGAAGLAAAVYTCRALLKTLILERTVPGGQILGAYDVDNYPGFPDGVSGPDLSELMYKHATRFGAQIRSEEVLDIRLDGADKIVKTRKTEYRAPIVVVASGADYRKLDVPGETELSGRGVSYCATCDGPMPVFRNQPLVVVGGGDSAITEGIFLTRFASKVHLIHRRQGFRAKPGNLEDARSHEKFNFVLDSLVTQVLGDKLVEGVKVRNVQTGEESTIDCKGVFVFIGHTPNTGFLASVLPDAAGDIVDVDAMTLETRVPGLFAVGDVRRGSVRQVATSVGDGVTAAMLIEHRIKELRA